MLNNQPLFRKMIGLIIILFALYYTYIIFYHHKWQYITPTEKEIAWYSISSKKAINLYQLMKDASEIFDKYKITYWIEGGTLLGAIRHKGIIPFDDDLDINILHDEEIKFQNTVKEFELLGYKVRHSKIYCICNKIACLDIFVMHKINNKFLYTNLFFRKNFPKNFFYTDEVFPLKKYQFGILKLYGPNNPYPYLDRQYPEWEKYAIIYQPHNNHIILSNIEKKTKFILTPKLLEPAKPTGPLKNRIIENSHVY